ncbi:hypothetical protein ACNKHW_02645 [Shigella flexneri]
MARRTQWVWGDGRNGLCNVAGNLLRTGVLCVIRRCFSRKNEDIEHSHTVDHH